MHPGKRVGGEASNFVAIVTDTLVHGALGVERPWTYLRRLPKKSKEELAPNK